MGEISLEFGTIGEAFVEKVGGILVTTATKGQIRLFQIARLGEGGERSNQRLDTQRAPTFSKRAKPNDNGLLRYASFDGARRHSARLPE